MWHWPPRMTPEIALRADTQQYLNKHAISTKLADKTRRKEQPDKNRKMSLQRVTGSLDH